MRYVIIVAATIALTMLTALGSGVGNDSNQSKEARELQRYRCTYLKKTGTTNMVPGVTSYDLRSFDGGHNWYAVRTENSDLVPRNGTFEEVEDVVVLGEAEKVYPGLLKHLAAMDKLYEHTKAHGPLTLSGARDNDLEEQLLKDAGFTVEKK